MISNYLYNKWLDLKKKEGLWTKNLEINIIHYLQITILKKKSLFKTSKVFYSDIVKIYITVLMYDNKEKNIKEKYNYSFKIVSKNNKKIYFTIYTIREEFVEVIDFLSSFNIIILTIYYDETAPNGTD